MAAPRSPDLLQQPPAKRARGGPGPEPPRPGSRGQTNGRGFTSMQTLGCAAMRSAAHAHVQAPAVFFSLLPTGLDWVGWAPRFLRSG